MKLLSPFLCLALGFAPAHGADLALVQDGEAKARIVLPRDPAEHEVRAAQELQTYLRKISAAQIPVSEDRESPGAKVLIGVRDEATRSALGLAALKYDGFVMKRDGDTLVLAGNTPEGTRNAVCAFLEDVCGVRWFMPTELGEHVPKRATIRVRDLDGRFEPVFACRRNHGIDQSIPGEGGLWRYRVRITSHDLTVPFNRYSHNLSRILPMRKYAAPHPEYYPMRAGRRFTPAKGPARHYAWQPCTINPEVVKVSVSAGRKWFDRNPRTNFFSVGMNDTSAFCDCGRCRALDVPGEQFRRRRMVSDRYFTFVKAVADALAKTHPDRYVSCIAYSTVESPPKRVEIPKNVFVVITQDVCQWHDPEYRKVDEEFARAWAAAAGAFGTYEYTALSWNMPRVYPHLMAEALRFYGRIGAVAATNEAWPTWWYCAPQLYLRAKLMWNPGLDADAVLDEFYQGFFGPASQPMKRAFEVFERCTTKPRKGRWFEGLGSVIDQMKPWEPNDVREVREQLTRAKALAAGNEPYSQRVALVARGWAWADVLLEEYWLAQRVESLAADPASPCEAVLDETLKLIGLGTRRQAMMDELVRDRYMWGLRRLTQGRFTARLASWRGYLNSAAMAGATRVASAADALSAAKIDELLTRLPPGQVAADMRAHLWAAKHPDAPNLLRNPGFEVSDKRLQAPAGIDWVATDCPPGWSKWALKGSNRSRVTWERTGGIDNSRCARVRGCEIACFIQKISVKPGERYHASTMVRTEASDQAMAQLKVRWQDAKGRWLNSLPGSMVWVKGKTRGWHKLAAVVTVPHGAGQLVMLPGASKQSPNDMAWHDELRLVRVKE